MNKINLSLDINEVNVIIKALSERPFREVYELVSKIHTQSNGQIKQNNLHTTNTKSKSKVIESTTKCN